MHILENIDEPDKRPEAAFLIPSEFIPTSLFNFSQHYWESRQELMSEGYGTVIQQVQYETQSQQAIVHTDTLTFDARGRSENMYVWQLSRGSQGARTIWQIFVNKDVAEGRSYRTNNQGRLIDTVYIEDKDELRQLWGSFTEIINSDETIEHENKRREDNQLARDKLLTFEQTRRMSVACPTYENGVFKIEYRDMEVFNERYTKQHERLSEIVRRIGFTALPPFAPL